MDYFIETAPLETLQSDCTIIGVYQDLQLCLPANVLDNNTRDLLNTVISRGDIKGKLGDTLLINVIPNSTIERILLVGLGENKPLATKNFRKALYAAVNLSLIHI